MNDAARSSDMALARVNPRDSHVDVVPARADARLRAAIDAHHDAMWRFLRRMGVPESSVEDAAQQVLVIFARKLDAIEAGAERSFLFGTALRIAADVRKQAGRSREVLDEDPIEDALAAGPAADVSLDDRRARRILDEILSELPEEMRAVFVMCEIEELTMAEVAASLEIAAGTVASRLRRARELFARRAAEMRERLEQVNEVKP